jgi:hypothetical protein
MRFIDYTTAKDLAAAQELARDLGIAVPLIDVTRERRAETLGLEPLADGCQAVDAGVKEQA